MAPNTGKAASQLNWPQHSNIGAAWSECELISDPRDSQIQREGTRLCTVSIFDNSSHRREWELVDDSRRGAAGMKKSQSRRKTGCRPG